MQTFHDRKTLEPKKNSSGTDAYWTRFDCIDQCIDNIELEQSDEDMEDYYKRDSDYEDDENMIDYSERNVSEGKRTE
jgi:hypothetical protein